MNPYKEYLKMGMEGLKNLDKVAEGLSNTVLKDFDLLSDDKKQIIAERMETCLNCPFNSVNAKASEEYLAIFGKPYSTERSELHCSLCGCVCTLKTASLSSNCGAEVWNARHPNNPELHIPLKWSKLY